MSRVDPRSSAERRYSSSACPSIVSASRSSSRAMIFSRTLIGTSTGWRAAKQFV